MGDQNSKTPEPIDKKFGMGDYVVNNSQHAKTENNCPVVNVAACA